MPLRSAFTPPRSPAQWSASVWRLRLPWCCRRSRLRPSEKGWAEPYFFATSLPTTFHVMSVTPFSSGAHVEQVTVAHEPSTPRRLSDDRAPTARRDRRG